MEIDYKTPQKSENRSDNIKLESDSQAKSAMSDRQTPDQFIAEKQETDQTSVHDDDVQSLKSISDGVPELNEDI